MLVDSVANHLDSEKRVGIKGCEEGVLKWKLWFVEEFNALASTAPRGFNTICSFSSQGRYSPPNTISRISRSLPMLNLVSDRELIMSYQGLGYYGAKANLMTFPPFPPT